MQTAPRSCAQRLYLFLFALAAVLHPLQGADLQVPILGFVVHQAPQVRRATRGSAASTASQSEQVRPVLGIPGAAALGDPIALPRALTHVVISPTQTYLLAERSESEAPALLSLGSTGAGPELTISGAFPRSDRIDFSISGSAASLYSASLQSVQVITGLPSSPHVTQQFDVSSVSRPLTALAVSDDGTALLAGVSDGEAGGIYLISAHNGIRNIVSGAFPAAIQFLSQSDSALVADSKANQVVLLSGITGSLKSTVLAAASDGAKEPNQIQMIGGNKAALVANTNSKTLLWIDMPTGKSSLLSFSYRVEALYAVTGSPVALLSSTPSALWLVNQATGGPSVTFIPGSSGSAVLP